VIVYQLACEHEHYFEGWFASPEACEQQAAAGRLQCPACSSQEVRKLPAAPHVRTTGAASSVSEEKLRAMVRAEVVAELRRHIVASTEDVGRRFPEVARRIHYREEEERAIRGRATRSEAEALREEGIETLVLSAEVLSNEEVH
jgi:hypothetical protein